MSSRSIAALLVAAGRGTRMGGDVPKQFQDLGGRPVLLHTWQRFAEHPEIAEVWCVVDPAEIGRVGTILPEGAHVVAGGTTRHASVAAGLAALPDHITHVLIHDGARATVPQAVIDRVIAAFDHGDAAAPALPVTDALWQGDSDNQVLRAVPRDGLWRAQTPQGFALPAIRAAHAALAKSGGAAADDVEVARAAGLRVQIVSGHEDNLKLTYPEDMPRAEALLRSKPTPSPNLTQEGSPMDIRLGNGFDVHAFCDGDAVILCGVKIPHDRALKGHSDADVGMHAITDAIYGALADGDIGQHFPPSDPQWKGAASDIFLRHAVAQATARGYAITNVDCTLICEHPKIGPHAQAMRAALAEIMGLDTGRISVKATTSERLGFTGRGEGIAALATATLVAP